jgi:hypothetical protein
MIRWICRTKPGEETPTTLLCARLRIRKWLKPFAPDDLGGMDTWCALQPASIRSPTWKSPAQENMDDLERPEAYSAERTLAIVRMRSPLNGSVYYSSEASACEQSWAFALLNRPLVTVNKRDLRTGNLTDNDPWNRAKWKSSARSSHLLSTPDAGMVAAEDK